MRSRIPAAPSASPVLRARLAARLIALLLAAGSMAACQLEQNSIIQHEDNLSAAGFVVQLANTADRQAMLHRLPANQFVRRERDGATLYVYADPTACSCLYVGNQQAFDRYVSNQQLDLYGQEKIAALSYYDAAWNWDAWGPWGPLGPIYGPQGW
jgi:hypothetical protein